MRCGRRTIQDIRHTFGPLWVTLPANLMFPVFQGHFVDQKTNLFQEVAKLYDSQQWTDYAFEQLIISIDGTLNNNSLLKQCVFVTQINLRCQNQSFFLYLLEDLVGWWRSFMQRLSAHTEGPIYNKYWTQHKIKWCYQMGQKWWRPKPRSLAVPRNCFKNGSDFVVRVTAI